MPVYAYKGKKGVTYHSVYFVNGRRKDEKIKFEYFAAQYLEVYCKPNHKAHSSDINNIKALKKFFPECERQRYLI